ncbi:MAG TPA: rhodanese-like domain-containing protein [Candidatus Acidoferrum sp.]|nr:rhodanese-like domain-containing protein [Candidatus Acidoferrum sp.]
MAATRVPAIGVTELRQRLSAEPKPFVLDVREPWEYAQGHVAEATLIPLGELEQRAKEVPRDQPVLVICQSGQRSLAAAGYLLQLGYRDVMNVDGGTSAWIEEGYPVSR